MNSRREKYSRIDSIEKLKMERARLDMAIKVKELELMHDWDVLKDNLSFSNIAYSLIDRISESSPIIQSVVSGFDFVTSLIGNLRGRKSRRRYRSECEYDM